MQSLKLLSSSSSWSDLNKKLEELTKSGQAKFAGDIFENVCKYFLQTAPQYQTKLKNVWLLKEVKEDLRRKLNLPNKDWSIYGHWVNPFEPINKGRLGSTQEWRIEKPKKHYY